MKNSKSLFAWVAFLTLITLVLSSCGVTATPTPEPVLTLPAATPSPTATTIRIGGIAPLSAPGSVVSGMAMQYAMNLAVADINDKGGVLGVPLELIFADTQGVPERGTVVAERLINENKVVAIAGEYHSSVGLTVAEVAHKYGIPVLFAETWSDKITETGYPEVFRIAPVSSMSSRATLEWYKAIGVKHYVLIAEKTDYGTGQAERDKAVAKDLGLTIDEIFFVELKETDFSPVLDKIKAMNPPPDAVRVAWNGDYTLEKQIADSGIAPSEKTIGMASQIAKDPKFWESVPNGSYFVFSSVGVPPSLYNEVTTHVATEYEKIFKTAPPSYALEAYDSVMLLADAIQRAGTTDPRAIISALESADITLAQGRYYFQYTSKNPLPADGSVPNYMWHQWPDPAILFMQYYRPSQDWKDAAVIWPPVYQTHNMPYIPYGTQPQ